MLLRGQNDGNKCKDGKERLASGLCGAAPSLESRSNWANKGRWPASKAYLSLRGSSSQLIKLTSRLVSTRCVTAGKRT